VVVAVGLTLVEPLADVDVNVPGVMATLAAPVAAQFSVLLAPLFMLVGFAANELIVGTEPFPGGGVDEEVPPQPASPAQAKRSRIRTTTSAPGFTPEELRCCELSLLPQSEECRSMGHFLVDSSGFVWRNRTVVVELTPSEDRLSPTASWL
jgi:hypothetical protein